MDAVNTQQDTAFRTKVARVSLGDEWRAYDSFGPKLREFVREAPIDISCVEVGQLIEMFEDDVGRKAAEKIAAEMYAQELASWVKDYRSSFDLAATRINATDVIS